MIIFQKIFPRTHATLEVSLIVLSQAAKRKQKQNTQLRSTVSEYILRLYNNFKTAPWQQYNSN